MSDVRVERIGEVDLITIDRPDVRNALRWKSYAELEDAVRSCAARCMVITGADPAFCSGDDVREVMGGGNEGATPVSVQPRLTPAADAILHTDIPVIAAVNGAAVGWGMELALMADIRVASEKAKFGELFDTLVAARQCSDAWITGYGAHHRHQLVGREHHACRAPRPVSPAMSTMRCSPRSPTRLRHGQPRPAARRIDSLVWKA